MFRISDFLHENVCFGAHKKRLIEALLIGTLRIYFYGEIKNNNFI